MSFFCHTGEMLNFGAVALRILSNFANSVADYFVVEFQKNIQFIMYIICF